jgi:ribosomal protein L21
MTVSDAGLVDTKPGLEISAYVIGHQNAPEKLIFKKRRRHGYERKRGCRQPMTQVRIVIQAAEVSKQAKAQGSEEGVKA